jgi:hypothetical protein
MRLLITGFLRGKKPLVPGGTTDEGKDVREKAGQNRSETLTPEGAALMLILPVGTRTSSGRRAT